MYSVSGCKEPIFIPYVFMQITGYHMVVDKIQNSK